LACDHSRVSDPELSKVCHQFAKSFSCHGQGRAQQLDFAAATAVDVPARLCGILQKWE
jgi:hypothetical protein